MSMIGYFLKADDKLVEKMTQGDPGEIIFDDAYSENMIDVDKTWHAIHFILSGNAYESNDDNVLSQLVLGGAPVNEEDLGYGPALLLDKNLVLQIAEALNAWDETLFRKKFNFKNMIANDIYPIIDGEDENDFYDYVWGYFNNLKTFIIESAEEGVNVITFIN